MARAASAESINRITSLVIEAAIRIHRALGPGLLESAYLADLIVEGIVIVEVKAQESLAPVHGRQMLTYLKIADCPAGLILNFGAPTLKEGIKRVLNGFPA